MWSRLRGPIQVEHQIWGWFNLQAKSSTEDFTRFSSYFISWSHLSWDQKLRGIVFNCVWLFVKRKPEYFVFVANRLGNLLVCPFKVFKLIKALHILRSAAAPGLVGWLQSYGKPLVSGNHSFEHDLTSNLLRWRNGIYTRTRTILREILNFAMRHTYQSSLKIVLAT